MRRLQSFETILIGKSVLIREGIARILRAANFRTQASVSCADDLPRDTLQPDELLFLIVHTGEDFDVVLDQIELLRDRHPTGRIAIVADRYQPGELTSAFRAGTNGYFIAGMACDVFTKSIELVMMGQTLFPPAFLSSAFDFEGDHSDPAVLRDQSDHAILYKAEDTLAPQLSPRETSILQCLIEGYSNKCIARKIDIAEATVKVHVKAILRKIRVQNRTQAAIWAINQGWLAPPKMTSSRLSLDGNNAPKGQGGTMCEMKRIEPSMQLDLLGPDTSQFEIARSNGFLRKEISGRSRGRRPTS